MTITYDTDANDTFIEHVLDMCKMGYVVKLTLTTSEQACDVQLSNSSSGAALHYRVWNPLTGNACADLFRAEWHQVETIHVY